MKTVTEHQRTKPMCYKERKNYNYKKVFHTNFFSQECRSSGRSRRRRDRSRVGRCSPKKPFLIGTSLAVHQELENHITSQHQQRRRQRGDGGVGFWSLSFFKTSLKSFVLRRWSVRPPGRTGPVSSSNLRWSSGLYFLASSSSTLVALAESFLRWKKETKNNLVWEKVTILLCRTFEGVFWLIYMMLWLGLC